RWAARPALRRRALQRRAHSGGLGQAVRVRARQRTLRAAMNQSTASGISRLPERLRWLFPTMRNVLIRRSLSTIDFGDVTSVLVAELSRILRQGGTAVVTVPFVFQDHGDYSRLTARALGTLFQDYSSVRIFAQGNRFHTIIDLITTAFSPFPVLFPLRLLSNLLCLVPVRFAARNTKSTAPSGF